MATASTKIKTAPEEVSKDESNISNGNIQKDKHTSSKEASLRTILWTLFGVLASILTMLYLGDVVDMHRNVPLSNELLSCLSNDGAMERTVNSIEIWATVDISIEPDIGTFLKSLDKMKDSLVESEGSYDTIGLFMSLDTRAQGTFLSVSRCNKERPAASDAYKFCDKGGFVKIVGEIRDSLLFGDRRSRFYMLSDHRRRFEESTTHLLEHESPNPRASPWFQMAIRGPKEGVWLKYLRKNREAGSLESVVAFAKTFRAHGNSVVPGMPGGGVVFTAAESGNIAACESRGNKANSGVPG